MHKIIEEKRNRRDIILDVIELLKPWLNAELWSATEKSKNTRANKNWESVRE